MTVRSDAAADTSVLDPERAALAEALVGWLETGVRPDRLFAPDVLGDLSVPLWRVRTGGVEELFSVRESQHPSPGTVTVEHLDPTGRGFLMQFEERWLARGQQWYSREMIHAVVEGGLVSDLTIYCTGDWDEATQRRHAGEA